MMALISSFLGLRTVWRMRPSIRTFLLNCFKIQHGPKKTWKNSLDLTFSEYFIKLKRFLIIFLLAFGNNPFLKMYSIFQHCQGSRWSSQSKCFTRGNDYKQWRTKRSNAMCLPGAQCRSVISRLEFIIIIIGSIQWGLQQATSDCQSNHFLKNVLWILARRHSVE